MSNGIDPYSIPIPTGVRQFDLIAVLTQRRVEGKPLGYGVLSLNPAEQQFFEEFSGAARRLGQYDKGQAILKLQRDFAKSGEGIASSNTGVIVQGDASKYNSKYVTGTKNYDFERAKVQRENAQKQAEAVQSDKNYALSTGKGTVQYSQPIGPQYEPRYATAIKERTPQTFKQIREGLSPNVLKERFQKVKEYSKDVGKVGVEVVDFTGSLFATVGANTFRTIKPGESLGGFKFEKFETPGRFANYLRGQRPIESTVPTYNIPLVNIEVPTKLSDTKQFFRELPSRPSQVFNIASSAYIGKSLLSGAKSGVSIFKAGRTELGLSKTQSLGLVGKETAYTINPFIKTPTSFKIVTNLKPFSSTQVNKGELISNVKIGEASGSDIYTTKSGRSVSQAPQTTVIENLITGKKTSLDTGSSGIVSLKENVVSIKPSGKSVSKGTREVLTFTNEAVKTGRYTFDTRLVADKTIQSFAGYGKGKLIDNKFTVSLDKATFKNLERQTFKAGYKAFGKNVPASARQQIGGISGRPSTAKGFGININTATIEGDLGTVKLGKSLSKFQSGGRRGVQFFSTKTSIPKKSPFSIEGFSTKETGTGLPKGVKVTRIIGKDTPGSATQILKQNLAQQSTATSLTPPKLTPSGKSLQIDKASAKLITPILKTTSVQANRLEQGLQTKSDTSSSQLTFQNLDFRQKPISVVKEFQYSGFGLTPRQLQPQGSSFKQPQSPNENYGYGSGLAPDESLRGGTPFGLDFGRPGKFTSFPDFQTLGGFAQPKGFKRTRKSGFNIAPSFSAIIQNIKIKSPLKVSRTFGVTPFQTRGLLSGKKPYFKLTNL